MAETTLEELRQMVRDVLGRPEDDTFYTDEVIDSFLNHANQAIATEMEWPWLVTHEVINTVAGTDSYELAEDWMSTKTVQVTTTPADPMEWMPLEELLTITSQGQPCLYKIEEGELLLRPIPNQVYAVTHYYYRMEPILEGDSDTPILPEPFVEALVMFAAKRLHQREGDPTAAASVEADYQIIKERMLNYKRRSDGAMRPRIRPGSEFG